MFILFCILLGIVFYFVTSNSNFGKVDPYPAGSGTSKVGYAMSSSWDSVWFASSNLKNFNTNSLKPSNVQRKVLKNRGYTRKNNPTKPGKYTLQKRRF